MDFLIFLLLVHVLGDEDQRQRCHVALRRGQRKEGKEGSERRGGNTDLPGSVTQMVDTSEDPPGQGRMDRVCCSQTSAARPWTAQRCNVFHNSLRSARTSKGLLKALWKRVVLSLVLPPMAT